MRAVSRPSAGGDHAPAAGADARDRRLRGPVRAVDSLAGLLAAGILLVGVVLLLAALIASAALDAAGLGPADGPGWSRVIAQLATGVAGEAVFRLRARWPVPVRVLGDLAVVGAVLGVIWWAWWP